MILALTNPIQNFNASYVNGSAGNDVFVTELNGTGTAAVYSTYVGGSSDDSTQSTAHSPAIAANATGDAFVVGETSSSDFPVTLTANPYRKHFRATNRRRRGGCRGGVSRYPESSRRANRWAQPALRLVVTLRNMGSNAMPITSITPSPSDYSETNTCGSSLAGGSECAITVTFTPTTAASRPGTLTIVQGGNNSPNVVNLTGTGVSQPLVTLNPTSLTFANQTVDTASPYQTVTVGNAATTSLTLSNPPFSISSNFAQTNNCPTSLAQNATCTVNIAFLPTQNGAVSGQMYVNSNSSGLATTYVSLSGNGVVGAPALTLSSAGMVFDPQVIGTTSSAPEFDCLEHEQCSRNHFWHFGYRDGSCGLHGDRLRHDRESRRTVQCEGDLCPDRNRSAGCNRNFGRQHHGRRSQLHRDGHRRGPNSHSDDYAIVPDVC